AVPLAVSFASKIEAIPLRAMSLVISYWSSLSPTATSRIGQQESGRTRRRDYRTRAQGRQSSRGHGDRGGFRIRVRDGRALPPGDGARSQRRLLRGIDREQHSWAGRRGRRRLWLGRRCGREQDGGGGDAARLA